MELQKTVDKLLEENRKLKQEKQQLLSLNSSKRAGLPPGRKKKKKKFDDGIEMEEMAASGVPGMERNEVEEDGLESTEAEEMPSSSGRNPLRSKSRSSKRHRRPRESKKQEEVKEQSAPPLIDRNDLI